MGRIFLFLYNGRARDMRLVFSHHKVLPVELLTMKTINPVNSFLMCTHFDIGHSIMMSPAKFSAPVGSSSEIKAETVKELRLRLTPIFLAAGTAQTTLDEAKTAADLRALVSKLAGSLPSDAMTWAFQEISLIEFLEK
jgi:hypothetical protein